jgi:hypothetical protein
MPQCNSPGINFLLTRWEFRPASTSSLKALGIFHVYAAGNTLCDGKLMLSA